MANPHHVVVRINPDEAEALPDEEVIDRWSRVFGVPALLERYGKDMDTHHVRKEKVRIWTPITLCLLHLDGRAAPSLDL